VSYSKREFAKDWRTKNNPAEAVSEKITTGVNDGGFSHEQNQMRRTITAGSEGAGQ